MTLRRGFFAFVFAFVVLPYSVSADVPPSRTFGVGPGFRVTTEPNKKATIDATLTLEYRKQFRVSPKFAHVRYEFFAYSTIHDWDALIDVYGWYGDGSRGEVAGKYFLRTPGLVMAPLFASNSGVGTGLLFLVREFHFDAGATVGLYIKPTDPELKLDIGFGLTVGAGVSFTNRLGLSARTRWSPRAVHSLVNRSKRSLVTTSVMFDIRF